MGVAILQVLALNRVFIEFCQDTLSLNASVALKSESEITDGKQKSGLLEKSVAISVLVLNFLLTSLNVYRKTRLFFTSSAGISTEEINTRYAEQALKSESEKSTYVFALSNKKKTLLTSEAEKTYDEDVKKYILRLIEDGKQEWRDHWKKNGGSKQSAMKRSLEQYPHWLIVEMEEIEAEQSDAQKRQQQFEKRIKTNSWSDNQIGRAHV